MNKSLLLTLIISLTFSTTQYAQISWERHSFGGGGAFSSVAQAYNGDIYAASDLSGIYKSSDNGASWSVTGSVQGMNETHIATFGFVESNQNTILVASGWGIYKSSDGGNSYTHVLDNGYIEDAELAPSNPNIGYAAYHEDYDLFGEIYKTTNGGDTWSTLNTNLPSNLRILKVLISNNDPNTVYILSGLGRFACSSAHLYKSTDGGLNWVEKGSNISEIIDVVLAPNDNEKIYITSVTADCDNEYYFIDDIDDGAFHKSTDGGDSFTTIINRTGLIWLNKNDPDNLRLIDPRFTYDWNDQYGTWSSIDDGQTWSNISSWNNLHIGWSPSQYYRYNLGFNGFTKSLVPSLSDPNNFVWCNAQFVYGSFDGGVSFDNLTTTGNVNDGWTSTGCDNIVGHPIEPSKANANIVYLGGYDIGLWRSDNQGQSWFDCNPYDTDYVWGGNGGSNTNTVITDPDRENVVWANFQGDKYVAGALLKSTDSGANLTWQDANSGLEGAIDIYGLSIDPNSPVDNRILYVTADGHIYKSIDDGMSWTKKLHNGGLKFTAMNPFNTNMVIGGGDGGLYRSANFGSIWNNIGTSDMEGTVTGNFLNWQWKGVFDITFDPLVENTVYVIVQGEDGGLYKSVDLGENWDKIYNNNYLRGIEINPQDSQDLYLTSSSNYNSGGVVEGSDGFLHSTDGGQTWTTENQNLSWLFGGSISFDKNGEYLYAWSPGVGMVKSADMIVNSEPLTLNKSPINIYPNPTSTNINIKHYENFDIKIYNNIGQLKYQKANHEGPFTLDISKWDTGIYTASTSTKWTNKIIKIVKK